MANKSQKGTTKRLSSQERDANKLHKLLSSPQWGIVSAADTFIEWTGEGSRLAWALAQVKAYEAAAPQRAARKAAEAAKASMLKESFILKYSLPAWAVLGNTSSTLGVFASQVEDAMWLVSQAEHDLQVAKHHKSGIEIRERNLAFAIRQLEALVEVPAETPATTIKLMLGYYASMSDLEVGVEVEKPMPMVVKTKKGAKKPVAPDLFVQGYTCHKRANGSVYYSKNGIKYTSRGIKYPTPICVEPSWDAELPHVVTAEEKAEFRRKQVEQQILLQEEREALKHRKELEEAGQLGADMAMHQLEKEAERIAEEQLAILKAKAEEIRKAKEEAKARRLALRKQREAELNQMQQMAYEHVLATTDLASLVEKVVAKKAAELGLSKYLVA